MAASEQDILHAITELVEAFNTHDPHRFAARFAQDAQFTDVLGTTVQGRDAIAALHTAPFSRLFQHAVLMVERTTLLVLTAEVASVNVHWAMQGHTTGEGQPLPPRMGIMHVVLIRRGERWWPVVAHNTDYTAADAGR